MQSKIKQPRLPRLEREEPALVREDENSYLWAVSYSDFLMALLCFFILFYSTDRNKRRDFILNLSREFTSGGAPGAGGGGGANGANTGRLPANIMDSLKQLDVKTDQEEDVLVLNFPDNFFSPGDYSISKEKKHDVLDLLAKLKPYESKVDLYFVGHADNRPFRTHGNSILRDNYVLSSLRASSALLLAKEAGFSEERLFIQADSSNVRNSRSLSIRIDPKGARL